jgi:hypothetical protein
VSAQPAEGASGPDADVLLATDAQGARWRLRRFADAAQARSVAAVLERLPGIAPRLGGREGRWLMIEALAGVRPATEERLWERAGDVGRLFAEVHARGRPQAGDADRWLERRLERLLAAGALDEAAVSRVRERHAAARTPERLRTTLDLFDPRPRHLAEDAEGRWRVVHEDGVGERVRGLGLGAARRAAPDEGRWEALLAGYASAADASWLDATALGWLCLLHAVSTLDRVVREGATVAEVAAAHDEVDRWSRRDTA